MLVCVDCRNCKTPKPHHPCFLASFLPFLLAALLQFALFQKYVWPRNPRSFKYYILPVTNVWGAVLLSFFLLIAAVYNLPEREDSEQQLFFPNSCGKST